MKTGLEIREAIKKAEELLLKARWAFEREFDNLSDEEINDISLAAQAAKDQCREIINTADELDSPLARESKLSEDFAPETKTREASQLYMDMLDYLLMTDDPKYNRIVGFRRKINAIQDPSDKAELIKYFNHDFGGSHTTYSSGGAWEYYNE